MAHGDPSSDEDARGEAMFEWCVQNGYSPVNTGEPTYFSKQSFSAPDVTLCKQELAVSKCGALEC